MLKKHNKLILLLVLATFMFSIVGSASAAKFSDVSGDPVQTAAIYKLNALGIIDGYPDGTFGPDKTISRAEFAKIAVNMAGLQTVASGMGNAASTFKDVNTSDWFNGFVNVAAAQGYVKGDPSGNFRPNDQINQGEVITVLMRLLGYNDNLPGEWPADYIAKASNLEVIKYITFAATKAATRAEVASMGSETLNKYMVEYQADSNTFINDTKVDVDDLNNDGDKKDLVTYTLVEDKFKGGLTEDALVSKYIVPDSDTGKYKLTYYASDNNKNFKSETKTVAKDFVVANGKSILDTSLRFIDFIVNDDDEIVFIAINDYGTVKDDEIDCKDLTGTNTINDTKFTGVAKRIEMNDKDYDFAENVIWSPTGKGVPFLQQKSGKEDGADWYTATLNDDGDVAAVNVTTQPSPGIVEYVNAERETISFKVNPDACLTGLGTSYGNKLSDLANKTYFVNRNGMPAKLADIKEDDSIFVLVGQDDYGLSGFAGVDYYIVAIDAKLNQIKGKLQSVEANADGTLKKVTVGDKEYKAVNSKDYNPARDLLAAGTSLIGTGTDGLAAKITAAVGARVVELMGKGQTQAQATAQAASELVPANVKAGVSTDSGDEFYEIEDADYISGDEYDLLDEEVTLVLTPNGKVGNIISDVDSADTGKIYASIITIVPGTTKGSELVDMIKVVNREDKEVSYAIDDDTTLNGKEINEIYKSLALGQMVALTLTGDGCIDNIKTTDIKTTTVNKVADVDDDLDSIKINNSWYAAKQVVVYNYKSADKDTEVMKWNDIQDTIKSGTGLTFDYYLDNNEVKYIAIKDAPLNTEANYAVFVKNGKDNDDPYAVIIKNNKEEKVYLNNNASYEELKKYKKGNLLAFKYEGSDIKVTAKATLLANIIGGGYAEVTDTKIKSNIVEINEVAYLVDEDTVVYDSTNHDSLKQLTLNDVQRGDDVYAVYDKDGKALAAIVITDKDDAKDVGIGLASGTVTPPVDPPTNDSVSVKLTATASGIGNVATLTRTGFATADTYKLFNAAGTALTGSVKVTDTVVVMFVKAGDTVKVELYKADGTLLGTKTVTAL